MRSKVLEAFRGRWFSARTKEEARAPAAELCLILRMLSAERNVLPMPHDFVLRRMLHTILHGDPDLNPSRKTSAASHCEQARQVPPPPLYPSSTRVAAFQRAFVETSSRMPVVCWIVLQCSALCRCQLVAVVHCITLFGIV